MAAIGTLPPVRHVRSTVGCLGKSGPFVLNASLSGRDPWPKSMRCTRQTGARNRGLVAESIVKLRDSNDSPFDALECPKTMMHFSAAEGAGGHCEMGNRSLLNGRVLDWLDEQLETRR
jgi:hypothetical protein